MYLFPISYSVILLENSQLFVKCICNFPFIIVWKIIGSHNSSLVPSPQGKRCVSVWQNQFDWCQIGNSNLIDDSSTFLLFSIIAINARIWWTFMCAKVLSCKVSRKESFHLSRRRNFSVFFIILYLQKLVKISSFVL